MSKLDKWIERDLTGKTIDMSSALQQPNFIKDFATSFNKVKSFESPGVKLFNEPFQVAVIDNVLENKSIIQELVSEIETMEWTRKQMDLYEFWQTTDLANVQTPHLSQFYNFLNTSLRSWMEQLTGMKFQRISASCSMYNCGDYLLTHDDLLSDRLIAFVFYLSPWKGMEKWSGSTGGALELFECDSQLQPKFPVVKKFFPANNQLAFFKVEKKSHHQVGEVHSKDFPRLTINGWFHGFKDNQHYDADAITVKYTNMAPFRSPIGVSLNLENFINKIYLKDSTKITIQKQIEENSEAALHDFLLNDVKDKVSFELESEKCKWITKGPSNLQNFEFLQIETLPKNSAIKRLIDMMKSKLIFKLLHEYTELDFSGKNAKKPECSAEIQRWTGGCYTLIGDPSTYKDNTLDLVLYFGNNEGVGVINYLSPEGDSDGSSVENDGSAVLTMHPSNNLLNIIYRTEGTAKFTKYVPKSTTMDAKFNYLLVCSYRE